MIAHGKDDVDVGRNLTVTGEYVEVSTWISSKKFIREDVHTRILCSCKLLSLVVQLESS